MRILWACVASVAISAVASWEIVRYRSSAVETQIMKLEEHLATDEKVIETLSRHEDATTTTVAMLNSTLAALQVRVESIVTIPTRPAAALPQPAPAQPKANWWCYFGRDCYRDRDECAKGDDARAQECKPRSSAWCGGKGGVECFADMQDCIERYSKLAFASGQLYPDPAPDVRQCTELQ